MRPEGGAFYNRHPQTHQHVRHSRPRSPPRLEETHELATEGDVILDRIQEQEKAISVRLDCWVTCGSWCGGYVSTVRYAR